MARKTNRNTYRKLRFRAPSLFLAAASAGSAIVAACTSINHDSADQQHLLPARQPTQALHIEQAPESLSPAWVVCADDCPQPTPKTPLSVAPPQLSQAPTPPVIMAPVVTAPQPAPNALATAATPPAPQPPPTQTLFLSFATGSSRLDEASRRKIQADTAEMRRASSLTIVGRTDNVGDQAINDRLAKARVLAVVDWIRNPAHGIHTPWTTESKGLCCYVADNDTPDGRAQNRRVEIVMTFDTPRASRPVTTADAGSATAMRVSATPTPTAANTHHD